MRHFCQQASRLASDALEYRLSVIDRLRLRLHMMMCGNCRNFEEEIKLLHDVILLIRGGEMDSATELAEVDRENIRRALNDLTRG